MVRNSTFITPDNLKEILKEVFQELLQDYFPKIPKDGADEFFTRNEACKFLKIGATKFNELRKQGIVTPVRLGRKTIYKKSELLEINTKNKL